ncbi:MAG TPA: hypothetical protein VK848_07265, partial [Acidimicrobiia bacterium]|nr:hypothetical protein [Acidimicrobiia bacterium]
TFMKKPRTADCPWCGAFSDVAAVVYFDVNYGPHGDWRIMSSNESLGAYKEAALDPYFQQLQTISWPPASNRTAGSGAGSGAGASAGTGPGPEPGASAGTG